MKIVECDRCKTKINKHNDKEVPLMFNIGNGPKYICAVCYPSYVVDFSSLTVSATAKRAPFVRRNRGYSHE